LLVNGNTPTSAEQGDIPKLARYYWMVHKVSLVFRRKLRAQRVLYCKAVFFCFEQG